MLFLGKCGGLKDSSEIGNLILPIAAIRGDGTSNDYFPPEVPALPSFKLHKFVSDKILDAGTDYRTGVIYTTNRRVWEHDKNFLKKLIMRLKKNQSRVSLFIEPSFKDLVKAKKLNADCVEIHTGKLCNLINQKKN